MIYVQPGATFTALLDNAPSGLVGTLGVRIENADGTNQTPRTTAGIVELEAASGSYVKADLVAPATAGTYFVMWDTGSDFASEELVVNASGAPPAGPFGPGPFISRQDLTDYLGRNVNSDDGALIACDAACEIVRTFAGQLFNKVVGGTATLDGTGTDALLLPELPVSAAGTVVITAAGTTTTYGTADYRLNGDGILFAGTAIGPLSCAWPSAGIWPTGRQNITVTYDHGYDTIPSDVRMVALTLASRMIVQGVAKQENLGDQSITYAAASTELTPTERTLLAKYRRSL